MDRIKAGFLTAVGVYGMLVAVHVVIATIAIVSVLVSGQASITDIDGGRLLQAILSINL